VGVVGEARNAACLPDLLCMSHKYSVVYYSLLYTIMAIYRKEQQQSTEQTVKQAADSGAHFSFNRSFAHLRFLFIYLFIYLFEYENANKQYNASCKITNKVHPRAGLGYICENDATHDMIIYIIIYVCHVFAEEQTIMALL
jgi:hypothetical protein